MAILAVTLVRGSGLWADESVKEEFKPIPRLLPPEGIELPADVQASLRQSLDAIQKRLSARADDPRASDVAIFTKAVDFALRHREFYLTKDADKAVALLAEASKRLDELKKLPADAVPSWAKATGLIVRGYKSQIDDSPQPYGLVIPEDYDASKPVPLYVWLHGRGDKNTDLHFINERMTRPGQIAPPGAIVLHPFGRHCVGFKFAGEIDVLEAMDDVQQHYTIDSQRIVLIGFSMGGAGAWHIGAHYADRFCAISPGAGFAETARYRRLKPENFPPEYEQKLWGLYDVPNYTRNLFNTPVIAYSGELDKQIQAARVMEEAFTNEGRTLTHLIGPGVEHKYEPETLKELLRRINEHVKRGRGSDSDEVHLQTKTLRYAKRRWIQILGMEEHWKDARVDARPVDNGDWQVTTTNVRALGLSVSFTKGGKRLTLDGQGFSFPSAGKGAMVLFREADRWREVLGDNRTAIPTIGKLKRFLHSGPIDDAFLDRFLVVLPSGKSPSNHLEKWVAFESQHFLDRWRALMRGEARLKMDVDVTDEDLAAEQNLVLWGDASSNRIIARLQEKLPVKFGGRGWTLGGQSYESDRFAPVLIYPHPSRRFGYIVLNSGLTFREAHDNTNSNQNPKLPDWAIIDLSQPPDASSSGRIQAAGFFDEQWQLPGAE